MPAWLSTDTCSVHACHAQLLTSCVVPWLCAHAVVHPQVGKKNRSVGATLMNQDSSRSHSVFSITIETIEQGPASVGGLLCMEHGQAFIHWAAQRCDEAAHRLPKPVYIGSSFTHCQHARHRYRLEQECLHA